MLWIRECVGWLLVMLSLYLIRLGLVYLTDVQSPKIVEAGIIMMTALGVLRAGILLIRLSAAARICAAERGTVPKSIAESAAAR